MIGNLQIAPRFTLQHHQIGVVLCQVRFSPILRLNQQAEVAPFQEKMREQYPGFFIEPNLAITITPQGVSQQNTGSNNYRFVDASNKIQLVLGLDFVAIETHDYVEIEDLIARVQQAVAIIQELYRPAQRTRLGLRFINELRFETEDLQMQVQEALNPQLLGPLGDPDLGPAVSTTQSVLQLTGEGGTSVQMIHGLNPQGGTTVAPIPSSTPPVISPKPFYLLDFDAFVSEPVPLDAEVVAEQAFVFNDQIRTLFAWSTTDEYRLGTLGQALIS